MTRYANDLEALIYDCGGPERVSEAFEVSKVSVWNWIRRGHIPLTDLKGKTSYSESLEKMQRRGKLTARQIRLIGLNA